MNRRHLIQQLAPIAPPCFATRLQWLEFLVAAAEEQRGDRHHGPLIFEAGGKVRLNARLDFCSDCLPDFQERMQARRRCSPAWLESPELELFTVRLVPTVAAAAPAQPKDVVAA